MDIRSPLYRSIAAVLAGLVFLNPIVAAAAELAVDAAAGGNTSIGAAGNGVPVVNIAAPNGAGLSHNKFTDYNVGPQGLILNNATQAQLTQMGGTLDANTNLGGHAASRILNEVTGGNPSQLRGYTEVAGQAAHVIVANPHGITCNGCGFINTPRATLTTGKPLMDGERLRGYDVDGGEITLEGAGLNAANIDQFELITRSTKLNAQLYANQLTVVTGRNQVDADTLAATAKADDGSARPQLAIDSSALGGMYAGTIRLVGTEQGVGVKLAGDMAASAGDILIDAKGKVSLAQTASRGDLRIQAPEVALDGPAYAAGTVQVQTSGTLSNAQSLVAGTRLAIDAAHVDNAGTLESGVNADGSRNDQGDLQLHAETLRNQGAIVASREARVDVREALDNRAGVIAAAQLQVDTAHLDNRGGSLLGERSVQLKGQSADNREQGLIQSRGALAIDLAKALDNGQGQLLALGRIDLQANSLNNQLGVLFAQQDLTLTLAALDNRSGQISSGRQARFNVAGEVFNQHGEMSADAGLSLRARALRNADQGRVLSQQGLSLSLDELHNNGGWVQSAGALLLDAAYVNNFSGNLQSQGDLSWSGRELDNRNGTILGNGRVAFDGVTLLNHDGTIASQGQIAGQLLELQQHEGRIVANAGVGLSANFVENSQNSLIAGGQSLSLQSFSITNTHGGELASQGSLGLQTGLLDNRGGRINSAADFTLRANQILNQAGVLSSGGRLDLLAHLLDNRDGGLVASTSGMTLRLAEQLLNQGGRLSSGADLLLATPTLDNSVGGQIGAGGTLSLQTQAMNNTGGTLQSGDGLSLAGEHLDNRGGSLIGQGEMHLNFNSVDNRGGRLGSEDDLILDAQSIDNTEQGELLAGNTLTINGDSLDNRTGRLYAGNSGELNLARLDNRQGRVEGRGDLRMTAASVDNQQGSIASERSLQLFVDELLNRSGLIQANQYLGIQGGGLDNGDGRILAGSALLDLQQLDNRHGSIQASDRLELHGDTLLNDAGLLASAGELHIEVGQLDSRQGELLAGGTAFIRASERLDLSGGKLHGAGDVQLQAGQILNREGGEIAATGNLGITAESLDNQAGTLSSQASMTLAVQRLDNRGGIASAQDLSATLGDLDNRGGTLGATASARIVASTLDNRGGQLSAGQLLLSASHLDNQNGHVLGSDTLSLFVSHLLNRAGVISSLGQLTLEGGSLDNRGGLVRAEGALTVTADQLANGDGEISTQGDLSLHLDQLDNRAGALLSDGGLLAQANQLLNEEGRLSALKSLDVRAQQLDNQQGELSSAGTLSVQANSLDNGKGTIQSQGKLKLWVSEHLENLQGKILGQGADLQAGSLGNLGGSIASGAELLIRGGQLNNSGGQLIADGNLSLEADSLDNSQGSLSAGGDLQLSTALLQQQAGEILSLGQLAVNAERLDNLAGRIASAGHMALQASELNNLGGTISSGSTLGLSADTLDNRQGLIGAQDALTLAVRTLDNRAGRITGNGELSITAEQVDNREGGELSAQGNLRVVDGEVDNRGGLIAGGQDVELILERLRNVGGRVTAANWLKLSVASLEQGGLLEGGSMRLDMRGKNLDNTGGRLSTGGSLSIVNTRDLINVNGQILTGSDLMLGAQNIYNQGGEMAANGSLLIQMPSANVYNDHGRMSAASGVNINSYSFSNAHGVLISDADMHLTAEYLDNGSEGLIQSGRNLYGDGGNIAINNHGTILAQNTVNLSARDSIVNGDGGRIASGERLQVRTRELDNQGGELNAQGDLKLYVDRLLQQQGLLLAGGDLDYDAKGQDLDNSGGVISVGGELLLNNLHDLINRGGTLASQQDINLQLNDLDNSDGLISGSKAVSFQLHDLTNQGGILASEQDLKLDVRNLDNSQGGLLDSATGSVDLRSAGVVDNRAGGLIQGNDLQLNVAQGLDNSQGTLSAVTGNLTLSTPTLDNTGGGLYAYENLILRGGSLTNAGDSLARGGRIGAGVLDLQFTGHLDNHNGLIEAAEKFDLRAASLDNQGGYLRDLGEDGVTRLQIAGLLDNRNGTLESANHDIRFDIGGLANQGGRILHAGIGEFGLSSGNIFQAGGLFGTNGLMTLQADQWVNDTIVRAGRLDLNIGDFRQTANGKLLAADGLVARGDNWTNDGVIATDGNLSLSLTGAYNGSGLLSSLGDLDLSALILNLNPGGNIVGGRAVDIRTTNVFNAGRITAADALTLAANQLNNSGTLGSGGTLSLSANTLNNNRGLIFSGKDMALRVDSLNNYHGDLYSLANLSQVGWAGGQAQRLDNTSGRISSVGDMTLAVASLSNHQESDANSALLDVGGSLAFTGSSFSNFNSQVFAAGDIRINAQTFDNRGTPGTPAIVQAGGIVAINASQRLGNGDVIESASAANPIRTPGNTSAISQVAPIALGGGHPPTRVVPSLELPQGGMFHLVDVSGGATGGTAPDAPASYAGIGTSVPGVQNYASDWQMADNVAGAALSNLGVRINVDGSKVQVVPPKGLNADGSVKRPGADVLAVSVSAGENHTAVDYSGIDIARFIPTAAGIGNVPGSNWTSPSHKYLIYTDPLIPGGGILDPGQGGSSGNTDPGHSGESSSSSGSGQSGTGGNSGSSGSGQNSAGGQTNNGTGTSGGKNSNSGISSDYLLALLGYDPDRAQKRLGDGLYEQYLVSQALIANTGKRFLDGFNSDAAVFRYLMDNAIAYKDRLQLTLGVALTAEQVAALTHDIVWMEEVEVNGEKVLVPVLYLASADGHLMADGSLIQGRDVTLISGGELANSGTLRAKDNLDIVAKRLDNSGQITAGQQLNAWVEGDIHNAAGGLIKGRDSTIASGGSLNNAGALVGENSLGIAAKSLDNKGWIDAEGWLGISVDGDLRNAASGEIHGGNISLDAGGALQNAGALVAADNLSIAARNLDNSGWVQAGGYVAARVTDSIHNHEGGAINGRDVLLEAQNGSLISEQGSQLNAERDLSLGAGGDLRIGNSINVVRDVSLVSGGDFTNTSSIRAGENLAIVAHNVDNSGQLESGKRLDILAQDSIRNHSGGLIKGGDVSLTALTGDILNERDFASTQTQTKKDTRRDDSVGPASRIEASGSLSLDAGRDILNTASALVAGGDMSLNAGRDLLITSLAETHARESSNHNDRNSSVRQHTAEVSAGGNISLHAGHDAALIATPVRAGGDIAVSAGHDVNLLSATEETHSYSRDPSGSKKSTRQKDHIEQIGTELVAAGNAVVSAGNDITLVSSKIGAGNEAYLVAGNQLNLLAANDSDYSLYDMKKKGSWGKKKTQHDESTHVVAVGNEITAGGPISVISGSDQHYQAAELKSGEQIALISGGKITFEAAKDVHQESHNKSSSSLAWKSGKGKGNTNEDIRQTELIAQSGVAIQAVKGLQIDYKQLNKKSVSQAIDAMVKADPGLAWIKEAEARGDVDWRAVKETHDSYKYSNSGLSGPAALAVVIVVTYFTWGTGSSMAGVAASSAQGAAANAVVSAAASQAAVSTINNQGNLGAVAKDVTSSDALKSYAAAGISGGVGASSIGLQLSVNAALNTVVQGGSFKDNLGQAAIGMIADAVSGAIYNKVGDGLAGTGLPTKVAVHALVGGLMAEAAGGDFRTGAMAAGANEAVVAAFGENIFPGDEHERLLAMTSNLIGVTVAAAAGGDDKAQEKAGWVTQQATLNNWLKHEEIEAADRAREACEGQGGDVDACQTKITRAMDALDKARDLEWAEHQRVMQEQAFVHQWAPSEYNAAMDLYWQGIDVTQVTFAGYAPAQQLAYIASQLGAGAMNAAVTWPGRTYDTVADALRNLPQLPAALAQAPQGGIDWLNSPIPAHSIERTTDQVFYATPDRAGGIVFDLAADTITANLGGKAVEWVGGKWVASSVPKGGLPEIKVIDGFYQAEGTPFKFSEYYYNRLWSTGRGAPFVQADEVLKTATSVIPDRKSGFFRYTNGAMEMIYNPATKEVWHLQPVR